MRRTDGSTYCQFFSMFLVKSRSVPSGGKNHLLLEPKLRALSKA
jgi:hypothetical protein